jgi:hypothetical protein
MYERLAIWFVYAFYLYFGLGLLFAVAFVPTGVKRLDPNAKGSGVTFRLLILPGSAAFWPLLLHRWIRGDRDVPEERNPHQ